MKKIFFAFAIALLMAGCGGGTQEEAEAASPEMEALQQTTEDTKTESEALESRADSLLNNL